jgi:sterol O-acyltransferase
LILGFYMLLHSWFNFWAEILRFPDRLFYEDWWNSLEFGTYYRKWNIVVHEWLYYYIYLDSIRFFNAGRFVTYILDIFVFLLF